MRAPTHSAGGALAALGVSLAARPSPAFVIGMTVTAFLAAPWPDLDNLGTWSRRKRGLIRWRTHPVKYRIAKLLTFLGTHRRGPAHSLAGGLIAAGTWAVPAAIWPWWPLWLPAGVLAGWWSHLFLDLANEQPVMLYWPSRRLVHGLPRWLRCKVGGPGEVAWAVAIATGLTECVLHLGWA